MDVNRYKTMLEGREAEIMDRLRRIDGDLGRARNPDSAERATESENDEVLEEFGHVGSDEMKAITAALKRIEDGTYGICVSCGAQISKERLEAVPQTPFCKACATAH
ncbi:TraR/DksA family transcriptional regulator [Martelella limonii]|uniref:TraR/DksA family transcriptional regulator n=1 Tax=Martelella limonii TaxID=1647649 RepID=UPI00157FEAFA|nr:TraR/DksA family transcriptional regulator [Martelella limonii]